MNIGYILYLAQLQAVKNEKQAFEDYKSRPNNYTLKKYQKANNELNELHLIINNKIQIEY